MSAAIKRLNYRNVSVLFQPETYLGTVLFWLLFYSVSYGQGNVFSAHIITDINFSQIDGDDIAGYHRIGYGAGLGVGYSFAPQWAGHLELMYRNVGSKDSPFSDLRRSIDIQQAQIPFYLSYRTWWVNGLSKFHFDGGLIYARNFRSEINFPKFEDNLNFINENNINFMIGFGIWFNHHHGIQARYIRSVTPLMKNPAEDLIWRLYYISIQYQYKF